MNEWLTEWAQWITGIYAELFKNMALAFIFSLEFSSEF